MPLLKKKRSQINNLSFQLKELDKEDQTEPKGSRRKERKYLGEDK